MDKEIVWLLVAQAAWVSLFWAFAMMCLLIYFGTRER